MTAQYLVFDNAEVYEEWIDGVNQDLGYPAGNTKQLTSPIEHPTSAQVACLYREGYVDQPKNTQIVDEAWMYAHGFFKRDYEDIDTEPQ